MRARTVAALYIDPRGPYPHMDGVECWDEARDARTYAGPHPVVAHPPCGPWGMFKHLCTKQDRRCGPAAVDAVRRFGGVLEHPAHSRLMAACRMPYPDEFPDEFGGRTYALKQVSWGHVLTKPTWIYVVGVPHPVVIEGLRTGGTATHRMTSGPTSRGYRHLHLQASAEQRRMTPPAFAAWLVALARAANLAGVS